VGEKMGQKSKAGGAQGVKEKGKAKNGFLQVKIKALPVKPQSCPSHAFAWVG
jgi:hypothetical protein